jgi:hypothetical protein
MARVRAEAVQFPANITRNQAKALLAESGKSHWPLHRRRGKLIAYPLIGPTQKTMSVRRSRLIGKVAARDNTNGWHGSSAPRHRGGRWSDIERKELQDEILLHVHNL